MSRPAHAYTLRDLVRQNRLTPVTPTTDTGYKTYGVGRLFLPAGTNHLTNPSFETDSNSDGLADGWAQNGALAGTPVYSRVAGRNGGYAQRIQYTGVAGDVNATLNLMANTLTGVGSFAAGDIVTHSFWVKGSTSGLATAITQVLWRNSGGGSVNTVNSSDFKESIAADWGRIPYTFGAAPTNTSQAYPLQFAFTGIHAGDTIDITIDDACLEKSAVLTPYFSGPQTWDSMSGCSWSGTANASTSTRTTSLLEYAVPSIFGTTLGQTGTMCARTTLLAWTGTFVGHILGLYQNNASGALSVLQHGSSSRLRQWVTAYSTAASAPTARTATSAVGRWDDSGTYLTWNNGTVTTAATAGAAPTVGGAMNKIYVGASQWGSYVGPVAMSPSCITSAEAVILADLIAGGATGLDLVNFFMRRNYRALVLPLQSDSVGYIVRA